MQKLQSYISMIYDGLDEYNTSKELTTIRHCLLNSQLGDNDNFLINIAQLNKQKTQIISHLAQLSEAIDDLELYVNQCLYFVKIEIKKNDKFAKKYYKYQKNNN